MSIPGYVRRWGLFSGIAVLVGFSGTASTADGNSSRSEAFDRMQKIEQREPIPYPTLRRSSSELRSGTSKTVRAGINGQKKVTYNVFFRDEQEVKRDALSSKILKKPVPEIVAIGQRGYLPSRGFFSGRKTLTMSATAYTASPAENGGNRSGRTAIGLKIGHGVCAVDPKYIPLGTRLYVEGYGYAVAADTGSAIKGNRIDLGCDSHSESARIGRRRVVVHILN